MQKHEMEKRGAPAKPLYLLLHDVFSPFGACMTAS